MDKGLIVLEIESPYLDKNLIRLLLWKRDLGELNDVDVTMPWDLNGFHRLRKRHRRQSQGCLMQERSWKEMRGDLAKTKAGDEHLLVSMVRDRVICRAAL